MDDCVDAEGPREGVQTEHKDTAMVTTLKNNSTLFYGNSDGELELRVASSLQFCLFDGDFLGDLQLKLSLVGDLLVQKDSGRNLS